MKIVAVSKTFFKISLKFFVKFLYLLSFVPGFWGKKGPV
jgi:hypothetical protein